MPCRILVLLCALLALPCQCGDTYGDAQWTPVQSGQDTTVQNNPSTVATIDFWNPSAVYNTAIGNLDYKILSINNSRSREGVPLYRGPDVMQAPSMITANKPTGFGISLVPGAGPITLNTDGHFYMGAFMAPLKGISFTTYMKLLQQPPDIPEFEANKNKLFACLTLTGRTASQPGTTLVLGRKVVQIWNKTGEKKGMQAPETIGGTDGENYAGNTSPEGSGYMQVAYQGTEALNAIEIDYNLQYGDVTVDKTGFFGGTAYTTPISFSCFAGGTVQSILKDPSVSGMTEEQLQALGASPARLGALYLVNSKLRPARAQEIMGQPFVSLLATPQNNSYLLMNLMKSRLILPLSRSRTASTEKGTDFAQQATVHAACFSDMAQHFQEAPLATVFHKNATSGPRFHQDAGSERNTNSATVLNNTSLGVWTQPFSFLRVKGSIKSSFSGALVGADYTHSPQWTVGCALGWGRNLISEGQASDIYNSALIKMPIFAPYVAYHKEHQGKEWSVMQNFLWSSLTIKGRRVITESHLKDTQLDSQFSGSVLTSNTYVGCAFERAAHTYLTPYMVLSFVHDRLGAFSEILDTSPGVIFNTLDNLRLDVAAHSTNYTAQEIGCQYSKKNHELYFGHIEYFITAAGSFLYSPQKPYSMNYVQNPSPYTVTMGSNSALYGSIALGAKLVTFSHWSMGLMGRVDISRLDTIYRAMAYIKKSL